MKSPENSDPSESTPEQYWQAHFESWRESGLTQSEYCDQAKISRHRFKYWRRKLEPSGRHRQRKPQNGFVPVQVQASPVEPSLSLRLANGMVLSGIDAGNVTLVGPLVKQL